MSDKYTDLLDTADRIAVVDLYPARLRTVISDLSAALRETSALLTESRDYGSALVEELRARTEKLDQLLLLANSMDADFESYAKVHPAVQPDLTDPVVVHANMLRGTIAKPTLDQIIHLYGVDALCRALVPAISREAALDEMTRLGQEFDAALKGESHE